MPCLKLLNDDLTLGPAELAFVSHAFRLAWTRVACEFIERLNVVRFEPSAPSGRPSPPLLLPVICGLTSFAIQSLSCAHPAKLPTSSCSPACTSMA